MTPAWIPGILAALMLAVAAVNAARLVAAPPSRRGTDRTGVDAAHLLMGIAMAGMLIPGLAALPGGAWDVIFGGLAAWFACQVVRDARDNGVRALAGRHCAPHLVHSAAMVYMAGSLTAPAPGMGGAPGAAMHALYHPVLALVFTLILAGYTVWDLDQLSSGRYRLASPRVTPADAAHGAIPAWMAGAQAAVAPFPGPDGMPHAASGITGRPPANDPVGCHCVARKVLLSAGTTVGCRIVMGVSMAYMLLIMI